MRRDELLARAAEIEADVAILLDGRRWQSAAYIAGYAGELTLKAYIASRQETHRFPMRKDFRDHYQHHLGKLIVFACLDGAFADWRNQSVAHTANWLIVRDWTPDWRYPGSLPESRLDWQTLALAMRFALFDPALGICGWIRGNI